MAKYWSKFFHNTSAVLAAVICFVEYIGLAMMLLISNGKLGF